MASCERCWNDARNLGGEDFGKLYRELIEVRNCTPEDQAGKGADTCEKCKRKTMHIYVDRCMNTECEGNRE